jgi:hypothetical protein
VARAAAKKKKPAPVRVKSRKVTVDRRRGGQVSVVVSTRPKVEAAPEVVRKPIKLEGPPLEVSRAFFATHQLQPLALGLPPFVSDEQVAMMRNEGFNRVLVFPPVRTQRLMFDAMVLQLLRMPSAALVATEQYGAPWLFDQRELANAEVRGRPEGAYLLAIDDGPYPEDTRDRKAGQLEGRFQALSQNCLTVYEYLVLQRLLAEERQDHRFDQSIDAHGFPSGWQYLLDTRSNRGAIHARWNEQKRRVEIEASPLGHFSAKRGAHPTLIRPL